MFTVRIVLILLVTCVMAGGRRLQFRLFTSVLFETPSTIWLRGSDVAATLPATVVFASTPLVCKTV